MTSRVPRNSLAGLRLMAGAAAAWVLMLSTAAWGQTLDTGQCMVVELFTRDACPQCDAASAFLAQLQQRHPRTRLVHWDLQRNDRATTRLQQIAKAFGVQQPTVPSIYMCRQLIGGFDGPETTGRRIEDLFTIHVYWREGCPRCAQAKRYLPPLLGKYPMFRVQYHEIVSDLAARRRFDELSRQFRVQTPSVPTFYVGGQLVVGFLDDGSTGRRIEQLLSGGLGSCGQRTAAPAADTGAYRRRVPQSDRHPVRLAALQIADNETPAAGDAPAAVDDLPPPEDEFDLPPPEPVEQLESSDEGVTLPFFGRLRVREIGLPAFTLAIGLVDGFNPCAMWVLLFLLSILVNLRDRRKIIAVAGTFVVVSGLVYLAFMAAWLNIFLLIGYMRPAQVVLGILAVVVGAINVKDFFAFHRGISLTIPESAKPGIYERVRRIVSAKYLRVAIVGAIVLAVFVNAVELLCSAGFPALYTQILSMQALPAWMNYGYLGLYIAAYMFDDAVMLGIVATTLTKTKLQERGGRWLKLISGLVILLLGLVMLFQPQWLV